MKTPITAILPLLLLFAATVVADKTAGQFVDDATIQAQVKSKLVDSDFFGGLNINIETRKGVVQLGGFIQDTKTASKAVSQAQSVKGVLAVDNQLHVKDGKASVGQIVDDRVISTTVKSKLASADLGTAYNVNVDVYNGVVLLTGFVDSAGIKSHVGDLAKGVDNVKKVINGVHVME